jgi:hypothetical protein
MQCRTPPHVAFVEWRGLTTTLLVGALGVENQQNGHLGTSLFPRNLILRVWVTEKVYELKQCQLMNLNVRFFIVLPQFVLMS